MWETSHSVTLFLHGAIAGRQPGSGMSECRRAKGPSLSQRYANCTWEWMMAAIVLLCEVDCLLLVFLSSHEWYPEPSDQLVGDDVNAGWFFDGVHYAPAESWWILKLARKEVSQISMCGKIHLPLADTFIITLSGLLLTKLRSYTHFPHYWFSRLVMDRSEVQRQNLLASCMRNKPIPCCLKHIQSLS